MHVKRMTAEDRRNIHRAVAEEGGLTSESEGVGRDRHVVIKISE